ncbi:hypothetical protein [Pyruvatibacter sp.]|uniref:hypothetical protein n=1 Tax=Pyruvatibacter sp. TaxID=1981328 RepID=UPI0032EE6B75
MGSSRRRSPNVTKQMAAQIKHLCDLGYNQHDIAARFGINQGRVSEINTGQKFSEVLPDGKPPKDPQPMLPF